MPPALSRSEPPTKSLVEADETYVGGYQTFMGINASQAKRIAVLGMLERNGDLRAKKIDHVDGKTVKREIAHNVWLS